MKNAPKERRLFLVHVQEVRAPGVPATLTPPEPCTAEIGVSRRRIPKTKEDVDLDDRVLRAVMVRAAELDTSPDDNSPMSWRARFHIWWRWHLWHQTLRPIPIVLWRALPRGEALKDLGVAVAILVGLVTLAQKCMGH